MGGWAALDLDFKRIFGHQGRSEKDGIRELQSMLKSCWAQLRLNQSLLGFYAFVCLSKEERRGRNVSVYLKIIEEHTASPWVCQMTKCVFRANNREQSRWGIHGRINHIAVLWSSERFVIECSTGIEVWPLWRHTELFRIPIDADECAYCVAISEGARVIDSGHGDGSVRLWDAYTGEQVGEAMYNHAGEVNSVSIGGNVIVSGSKYGLLYRYNVTTGEGTGNTLQGYEDAVSSVAINGDGKLIVSGSRYKTIRRWDADTGVVIGSPLRGHSFWVTNVAISTDCKLIVSVKFDDTVRHWRACTGEAQGEPLGSDDGYINCLAISGDDKYFILGSDDGEIRVWDALS